VAKVTKRLTTQKQDTPIKWTLFTACLITLFINPKLADPFNAPKLYLLICGTVILFGFLIFEGDNPFKPKDISAVLVCAFLVAVGISVLFTDVIYQAIFGDSLRQTGFIAYLGFSIYLLTVYKFFKFDSKHYFYLSIGALGFILTVYGIVQFAGKDPFPWINQYNPIISTLGNPNFTAALMAILATLTFSFIFDIQLKNWQKLFFIFLTLGLVITIYLSDAIQGLLSLVIGVGLFIILKVFKKNAFLGSVSLLGFFLVSIFAVAGILQKGPFERYLYKDSVSLRGHYWRAGLKMFRENIFSGVGVDSYGNYFKLYRDSSFPVRYGYDLTSNNAHNVPIQLFATGGIFVGMSYLVIIFLIIYKFIKGFKHLEGIKLNLFCGVFTSWVAFQSQSIVSIDNIGLTIWGWILGGLILALSKSEQSESQAFLIQGSTRSSKSSKYLAVRPIFTGATLLLAIILIAKLTYSESLIFKIRGESNFAASDQGKVLSDLDSVIKDPFAQPWYKATSADMLYQFGLKAQAIQAMEQILKLDQNNPVYLNVLASMYEETNEYEKSIILRSKLSEYDPYNVKNYLQLARLYKFIGNDSKAFEIKKKINQLDPSSEFAKLVNTEIV
jgi:O-antigen ligase